MRFKGTCFRFHNPRWSFLPTSGVGAARNGARFNPKGVEALYLTLTPETAFIEISQGFAEKMKPALLVSYHVDCADIVDLRSSQGRSEQGVELDEMACAWMDFIANGQEPPSWNVARRLIANSVAGIIVPSFATTADPDLHQNLVLWNWGSALPHLVAVYDPDRRLPNDQRSWEVK